MATATTTVAPTFLFEDRKRFDAECDHDRLRSSLQSDVEVPPTTDPWRQRPIDFSTKNFHPNRKKIQDRTLTIDMTAGEKKPQISRPLDPTAMQPFLIPYRNMMKRQTDASSDDDDDDDEFHLNTRIKYERVKRMLNTEQYKNPKPHDYRQYPDIRDLDIPEFETKYNRDPNNIRFLSEHLNTIWLQEREDERVPEVETREAQMYRIMTAKSKWESRLILPKLVFPNKYAAYTRYRKPTRTIQSAYWERVEDQLEKRKETLRNNRKHRLAAV